MRYLIRVSNEAVLEFVQLGLSKLHFFNESLVNNSRP